MQPFQVALNLLPLLMSKIIVDAVIAAVKDPSRGYQRVVLYLIIQASAALLSATVTSLLNYAKNVQQAQVTDYVSEAVQRKALELEFRYFEDPHYHDIFTRVQTQASVLPNSITSSIVSLLQGCLGFLGIVGILYSFHWLVAFVMVVSVVPCSMARIRASRALYNWQRDQSSTQRLLSYYSYLSTAPTPAREVRQLSLKSHLITKCNELRNKFRTERLSLLARGTLIDILAQVCSVVAMYASFAFVLHRAIQGSISLGTMSMYYLAFLGAQAMLQQAYNSLTALYESSMFLSDLDVFLSLGPPKEHEDPPNSIPTQKPGGVLVDNVSFRYPFAHVNVLNEVSLYIAPGEVVALVGANGSGKSTLTKLLCRLYEPCSGSITVDGLDIQQLDIDEYRSQVSVMFQDYEKYQVTVRENIQFGDSFDPPSDERVRLAAQNANAEQLISRLDSGYDTMLGKFFDGGIDLSGGQWQKIALARTLVRPAKVVILDEPTSAVDAEGEMKFFQSLRSVVKDCSVLLVSHRFSTVRMADRIYVIDDGRIIEAGTHSDLVAQNGMYRHLFESQAQSYR